MAVGMLNVEPLVSVIVPVYQVENYVRQCLDSIASQTYRNLDVIVVNDGSTDGSGAICRDCASRDARFRVIDRENGGLSAARNTGLDNARGDLVLFVDSDDYVMPGHIEALVSALEGCCADVAITNLTHFTEREAVFERYGDPQGIAPVEAVRTLFYQGDFDTCAPAKLYKLDLWDGIRFPVGYIHEDLPTTYKVLLHAKCCAWFPSDSYAYRYSSSGLNRSKTDDRKAATFSLVNGVVADIDDRFPELSDSVRCFRCSFAFHLLLNAGEETLSDATSSEIMASIKGDRARVLRDPLARKKTRAACALTYLGDWAVRFAFKIRGRNQQ